MSDVVTDEMARARWTPYEDQLLCDEVAKHGTDNWRQRAEKIPFKTGKQCRERWNGKLAPHLNLSRLTPQERVKAIELYNRFGSKWSIISNFFPGRTPGMIKNLCMPSTRKNRKKPPIHPDVAGREVDSFSEALGLGELANVELKIDLSPPSPPTSASLPTWAHFDLDACVPKPVETTANLASSPGLNVRTSSAPLSKIYKASRHKTHRFVLPKLFGPRINTITGLNKILTAARKKRR